MNRLEPEMKDLNVIRQFFLSGLLIDKDLLNKYASLKTDEEHFLLALETVVKFSTFLFDNECKQKDSAHSIQSRKNGNKSFADRHCYKALQEYTESILYAPDSSEELALAYGNRSAALFVLKKHAECVEDIDKSLDLNYPEKLRTKLYKRKGLCLTELGRPGADSSFQQALIWLHRVNLSQCEIDRIESELKRLISASRTQALKPSANKVAQFPEPKILSSNSELPCASDAVALKYSKKFGRHFVATRKIEPGEILAVERPYCMRLFSENIYTHCSYCLQVSWTLIPCKLCVNVAYCSDACKTKAWNEYHEIECPVVGPLLGFNAVNQLWLSLRLGILATEKGLKIDALKQELTDIDSNMDPRTKGFCSEGKFHSDKYRSIYTLACNVDKYHMEKLFSGALWVALTTCILARETEIFGERLELDTLAKNPKVIFLGGLMLKHTYIIYMNVHSFGAARSNNSFEHGDTLMAGCSLLNHSCDPNTLRQWLSDTMVLYAAYPIEEGEQIFDNYGPHYIIKTKSEREIGLSTWNFNCNCIPCIANWPLLEYLPSYKSQAISSENKEKISAVLQEFAITHIHFIQLGIKENVPNMLKQLLKLIETLSQLAQRPCKELVSAVAMLEDLFGLAEAIFDYIQTNPSNSEKQYLLSFSFFENWI